VYIPLKSHGIVSTAFEETTFLSQYHTYISNKHVTLRLGKEGKGNINLYSHLRLTLPIDFRGENKDEGKPPPSRRLQRMNNNNTCRFSWWSLPTPSSRSPSSLESSRSKLSLESPSPSDCKRKGKKRISITSSWHKSVSALVTKKKNSRRNQNATKKKNK